MRVVDRGGGGASPAVAETADVPLRRCTPLLFPQDLSPCRIRFHPFCIQSSLILYTFLFFYLHITYILYNILYKVFTKSDVNIIWTNSIGEMERRL